MKIAVVQIHSAKGKIEKNITRHIQFVNLAADYKADAVFFPELSLTGYEPGLAKQLATAPTDERLAVFQSISDKNKIVIGAGLPTISGSGICISMVIFQPGEPEQIYSKQYLHNDELLYFIPGNQQLYVTVKNKRIALAICYESLLAQHVEAVGTKGIDVYLASVAKSASGIAKANKHYPEIARKYAMIVLMANCVGWCDNFQGAGSSAAWNKEGKPAGKLDEKNEGLLIFDTETEQVKMVLK